MGGFLALLAAATFALNNAFARRGVLTGTVLQAMSVTVPLGIPLFLVAAIATDSLQYLSSVTASGYVLLSIAGIVHFVLGRYCNYRAVRAIGANLAGPVMESAVLFSLALAVVLLGEQLTIVKVLGILLILGGPGLTAPKSAKKDGKKQELSFSPAYFEGYFYGVLAAIAYGTTPILIRFALERASWQASIAGGLVSYVAATAVMLVFVLATNQTRAVRNMPSETIRWFLWAGVTVGLSQMLRYMALALAPVSVVSPIQRLSLIFRLIFSYMFNRNHEVFDGQMVAGTIVSLVGAALLSMSIADVGALVAIPDWLAPAFTWKWP